MFFSFGSLIFALFLTEVLPWTIDLPEARKFLFEKNDRLEKRRHDGNHPESEISKQVFLSNRYDSNSKHHEHGKHDHDYDHDPYAKDYGYQSYMEKKVRGMVYDGSEYLEGLQRSIQNFTELLENCTRMNQTNRYRFNATAFNATSFNSTSYSFNSSSTTPEPWRPINETNAPFETNVDKNSTECRRAGRASEHVRRLAELAIKATKDLQDIAYSRKYMKDDPHELSKEENELILKLAWFLDRLAYYTGFHPQPRWYSKDEYTTSTVRPPAVNLLNASDDTKAQMMNCLKQKSEVPATIRCAYPQEIPGVFQAVINNSNPVPGGIPSSSNRNERVVSPYPATSEQELLIATDNNPIFFLPYHYLSTVRHIRSAPSEMSTAPEVEPETSNEMSLSTAPEVKSREDPAITFLKYFMKHKIWESDNKQNNIKDFDQFEVINELPHRIQKRAIDKKLKVNEDPFQDLSKYVKNKKGVNYVKDEEQARKIRAWIEKINNSTPKTAKEHLRRVSKLFRSKKSIPAKFRLKRSYTYENDVDKPRNPDDLFKDISYYVKNRPGTNLNRDIVQAGQVRAGLVLIFSNPNIETVRRYASNFNPLIPDPLLFASIRSASDN